MKQMYTLETFLASHEALALNEKSRKEYVAGLIKKAPAGGFLPNSLAHKADIKLWEELDVLVIFAIIMGGPFVLFLSGVYCATLGSWTQCASWFAMAAFLAFHPLPKCEQGLAQSKFTLAIYKYFSYRFVWSGDALEANSTERLGSWIGAGPPHGVLPLANILSIPAINTFCFCRFVGAGASVVSHTPFLRYMTMFGLVDVGGKSMTKALSKGMCVGVVPDGIAGIFRTNADDEVVVLKSRKGIARLALRTGHAIVPAYSIGNTAAFSAFFDGYGLMERVSRKAQAALFPYWGRFGLPIPRRCNVTMLLGNALVVEKVEAPTQAQIDELHERLLSSMAELFDTHKAALGWGQKKIVFE